MARHLMIVLVGLLLAASTLPPPAAAQGNVLVWRHRQSYLEKPKTTARPVSCTGDVCSSSQPLESAEPVELPPGHYYPEAFEPGCLDGVVRIDASWNGSSGNVGVELIANGSWLGGQPVGPGVNQALLEQPFRSGGKLEALVYNDGQETIDVNRFGRTVGCNVRVGDLWLDLEFGVQRQGRYGMNVLANFWIDNQLGAETNIVAYFEDAAGRPLRDADGRYRTTSGSVSASTTFKPGHHSAQYDGLAIFIPYDQFHLPFDRPHDLRVKVALIDEATGTHLSSSGYTGFGFH